MKTTMLTKRVVSIVSLLLVMFVMLTACGGSSETSSNSSVASNSSETASDAGNGDTPGVESDTPAATESDESEGTASGGTVATSSTKFAKDPYSDIPAAVKKKEVHILMWRDYSETEKQLINGFTKKTGIRVRTTKTLEREYATKLVSLVSGNDSPDIVQFQAEQFPGLVTRSLQALDKNIYRLDDSCWQKNYMNNCMINGQYYGVAIAGSWSTEDLNYCTYYSPAMLKAAGITTNPYQLYKQGKWDWETQKKLAKQFTRAGKGIGYTFYKPDVFMLSAGLDFVSYDGKQYKNTTDANSSLMLKAWKQLPELNASGASGWFDRQSFVQGKNGFLTCILYGMTKDSDWNFKNMLGGPDNIQAVPVATEKAGLNFTPMRTKLWGTAIGSDNREGAAYFLRYWLDPNNCNMDDSFLNNQFKIVFKELTAKNAKKFVAQSSGVIDGISVGTYDELLTKLYNTTPANIKTVLDSYKGKINLAIQKANKELSRKR